MTAILLKPPIELKPYLENKASKKIFLAGTIERGTAVDWQEKAWISLASAFDNLIVFNPRRDDFSPEATQSVNNSYFYEQVQWEQDALEASNVVLFNFIPKTLSPITLMELGYALARKRGWGPNFGICPQQIVVCCPDGYWRQGNVEVMLKRAGIFMFRDYDAAFYEVKNYLR